MFANEGKDGAFVAEEDEGGFFQRSQAVLGAEAMRALARTKVAVFGLGGVGGWCAEALARTGVGRMLVVDADRVAPSNVNRQLVATPDTVGEFKASVLRRRLMAVNPLIEVEERCEFYDAATAATFGIEECDFVVDAIDSLDSKAMLIRHALSAPGVTLFSSMGAARRRDPLRVRKAEFWKVQGDGLARVLRAKFRKSGDFPPRRFQCVYSDEPPGDCGKGSLVQVTAVFGFALAGLVVDAATAGAAKDVRSRPETMV
jgi:tRNA A37 threonylcarbamoyladenosine dehydratase